MEEDRKKRDFWRQLSEAAKGKMLRMSSKAILYEEDVKEGKKKKNADYMGCLKVCMHG